MEGVMHKDGPGHRLLGSAGGWTRAPAQKGGQPKEKGQLPMAMGGIGHGEPWPDPKMLARRSLVDRAPGKLKAIAGNIV